MPLVSFMKRLEIDAPYGMKSPRMPSAEISYFPFSSGPRVLLGEAYCARVVAARSDTAADSLELNMVGRLYVEKLPSEGAQSNAPRVCCGYVPGYTVP